MILDESFAHASTLLSDIPAVERIVLNGCFTGVILEDSSMGIAMNIRKGAAFNDHRLLGLFTGLAGLNALEAAERLEPETDIVSMSVRVALLNALCRPLMTPEMLRGHGCLVNEDADDRISGADAQGKNVVIVGFGGNVLPVSQKARKVWVTELEPEQFRSTLINREGVKAGPDRVEIVPAHEAGTCFEQADLVLLTGCALVTRSMEDILEQCKGKEVVLYGSTACFWPQALFERGVGTVATRVVDDAVMMADFLANCGCMVERFFPKATREITIFSPQVG